MAKKKKDIWRNLISYLNSSRRVPRFELAKRLGFNMKTVDTYLSYLTKAGYLQRANKGVWRRKKQISPWLTIMKVL